MYLPALKGNNEILINQTTDEQTIMSTTKNDLYLIQLYLLSLRPILRPLGEPLAPPPRLPRPRPRGEVEADMAATMAWAWAYPPAA